MNKKQKVDKFANREEWLNMVGSNVVKHSGKTFKGGSTIGLVQSFGRNPYTDKEAFLIDDVWVDCHQVRSATEADLSLILR